MHISLVNLEHMMEIKDMQSKALTCVLCVLVF